MKSLRHILLLLLLLLPMQAAFSAASVAMDAFASRTQAESSCHEMKSREVTIAHEECSTSAQGMASCMLLEGCSYHCLPPAMFYEYQAPFTETEVGWLLTAQAKLQSVALPPPYKPPLSI